MMRKLRIIFMGTPEFSIPSLEILIKNNYNVVAVITSQDKPKGRGKKLSSSPVKNFAQAHKIPVLQPKNLKNPQFVEELRGYNANLQVVVAFRMLPEVVWAMPELGTFNLHASLLPEYRGAAPINWVLINGEEKTGLTTFFIKQEIDTGNIILQQEEPVFSDDDAGSLHDRLMIKGADLVLETVKQIEKGDYELRKQKDIPGMKLAPKIIREMCLIDWNKSQIEIYNFVRGLSPYPAAWINIKDKTYKIFKVAIGDKTKLMKVGSFQTNNHSFLHFQCKDGLIDIIEWQPEGKRRMGLADFFRGNSL
jgi:methionyl-tRNA formyltransferase